MRARARCGAWLLTLLCLVVAPGILASSDGVAGPEIGDIEAKLQALQTGAQDDPQKARLRDIYAATLDNLKLAADNREREAKYERLYAEAPGKAARYVAELDELHAQKRSAKSLDQTVALTRLERVLRDNQERLDALRERESDLQETAANLRRRMESARTEVKTVSADLARESGAPAKPVNANQLLQQASQDEMASRRALLRSTQSRLETELRTIPQRLTAVEAELQLVSAQRAQTERFVTELLGLDNLKRIGDAEKKRDDIDERARAVTSTHPEVRRIAEQNLVLSAEYLDTVTRLESVEEELAAADAALRDLKSALDSTRQQLEIGALHDALGPVLMGHYVSLREFERPDRKLGRLADLIAKARLRGLDVEQQLEKEPAERERIYRSIEESADLSPAERSRAVAESERLFADRHALLVGLDETYSRGIQWLLALDDTYHEQSRIAEEFLQLLDQNLVWMKSHPPLDADYIEQWPANVLRLFHDQDWAGFRDSLQQSVLGRLPVVVLALGLIVVLARVRFRLARRLESTSLRRVGWKNYRFDMALEALGIHLVLAAPLPLLVWFLGWLAGAESASALSEAIRAACYHTAGMLYGFMLIRYAFAESGFARQHLRWKTARVQSVERILRIGIAVMAPASFVSRLVGLLSAQVPGDESSRLVALIMTVTFFGFSLWVVRESRGMFNTAFFSRHHPLLSKISTLMVFAVIGAQPGIILLDVLGYHFTAESLYLRVLATVFVMFSTKVVFDTGLLGITMAAQRSRAAQRSESEETVAPTIEVAGPGKTVDATEEFDIERMNASAVALLNVFALGVAAMVLILLWRQFFAALQVLDHINLWSYSVTVEGKETVEWVSVFDFGAAMLTLVVTLVLARGLPSLLGIVFYSLITQKGVLFALQTVIRYMVGGIGTIAALQTLGFGWSKLQWMAAGLSVGVGFGMQEIFANFFSGLIMLFERPVRIGDVITLGEYSGTIQRIRMRATTITDFDNREIIVPNKMFVTERLINWTLSSSVVRISFDVGISYDSDPRLAHSTLVHILHEHRQILRDPAPVVIFREFGESSLNFRCYCHVEDVSVRLQVQNDLHMRITEVFRDKGIEIAYPQMDLHLRSVDEQARLRT